LLSPPHPHIVVGHLIVTLQERAPVSTEHHVTRDDLFAAVWERPLTKVAAMVLVFMFGSVRVR
jgi:hypothetical protein